LRPWAYESLEKSYFSRVSDVVQEAYTSFTPFCSKPRL
jgi:hypothetical protein